MAQRASGSHHQKLENVTDLTTLTSISDDIIVACLRERFLAGIIYTGIGSSALVAVNPYKYVPSTADSVLMQYAMEYRDAAEEKTYLDPHIFQLANNAYYHMRRTSQDQVILIRYVLSACRRVNASSSHRHTKAARQEAESRRTVVWPSRVFWSSASATLARKAQNCRPKSPPPNSSSSRLVMHERPSIRTPLVLENTLSFSSPTEADYLALRPLITILKRIASLAFLPASATFTYSIT